MIGKVWLCRENGKALGSHPGGTRAYLLLVLKCFQAYFVLFSPLRPLWPLKGTFLCSQFNLIYFKAMTVGMGGTGFISHDSLLGECSEKLL